MAAVSPAQPRAEKETIMNNVLRHQEAQLLRIGRVILSLRDSRDRLFGSAPNKSPGGETASPRPDGAFPLVQYQLDMLAAGASELENLAEQFANM